MTLPNLLLLTNLGSEMLYIIDQRLKAQNISKDKSAQVLREVTHSLLSPQFFNYVISTFTEELMSIAQLRIILSDIASCSLMRLDSQSLDKLIDLMVMIFKWQLFLMPGPDELLSITLRHLHGIGRLMPEQSKMILIDQANQFFFNHWNDLKEESKYSIVRKLNRFFATHNIRISLLIRMKLQLRDGSFVDKASAINNDFFRYYIHNLGENVYEKISLFPHCQVVETGVRHQNTTSEIDCLFQQFPVDLGSSVPENLGAEKETKKTVDPISNLEELKKKCKIDLGADEGPPVYEDNFDELISMLDSNNC